MSGVGHDCRRPALDSAVEVAAAPDVDAKAAVVLVAGVLPNRLWVVTLQRWGGELVSARPGNV